MITVSIKYSKLRQYISADIATTLCITGKLHWLLFSFHKVATHSTRSFHSIIMSDKPEDLLSCGICLEEYQNSGCHVPRLLPCTHTLCEKCLIELLGQQGGAKLTCPECRTHHVAPPKQRSFPQNKYLLTFIKSRDIAQSRKSEEESNEVGFSNI